MPAGYIFWMLMILWAVFGFFGVASPIDIPYRRHLFGAGAFLLFALFFLLGWKLFGFAVQ